MFKQSQHPFLGNRQCEHLQVFTAGNMTKHVVLSIFLKHIYECKMRWSPLLERAAEVSVAHASSSPPASWNSSWPVIPSSLKSIDLSSQHLDRNVFSKVIKKSLNIFKYYIYLNNSKYIPNCTYDIRKCASQACPPESRHSPL